LPVHEQLSEAEQQRWNTHYNVLRRSLTRLVIAHLDIRLGINSQNVAKLSLIEERLQAEFADLIPSLCEESGKRILRSKIQTMLNNKRQQMAREKKQKTLRDKAGDDMYRVLTPNLFSKGLWHSSSHCASNSHCAAG
jgi:hypothetical protein